MVTGGEHVPTSSRRPTCLRGRRARQRGAAVGWAGGIERRDRQPLRNNWPVGGDRKLGYRASGPQPPRERYRVRDRGSGRVGRYLARRSYPPRRGCGIRRRGAQIEGRPGPGSQSHLLPRPAAAISNLGRRDAGPSSIRVAADPVVGQPAGHAAGRGLSRRRTGRRHGGLGGRRGCECARSCGGGKRPGREAAPGLYRPIAPSMWRGASAGVTRRAASRELRLDDLRPPVRPRLVGRERRGHRGVRGLCSGSDSQR